MPEETNQETEPQVKAEVKAPAAVDLEPAYPNMPDTTKEALLLLLADFAKRAATQITMQHDQRKALDLMETLR